MSVACASHDSKPATPPATVIDATRPNVCAQSVPVFEVEPGSNSYQVDDAHQRHILELNRIVACFIELAR
jgi:hypothetical protein